MITVNEKEILLTGTSEGLFYFNSKFSAADQEDREANKKTNSQTDRQIPSIEERSSPSMTFSRIM